MLKEKDEILLLLICAMMIISWNKIWRVDTHDVDHIGSRDNPSNWRKHYTHNKALNKQVQFFLRWNWDVHCIEYFLTVLFHTYIFNVIFDLKSMSPFHQMIWFFYETFDISFTINHHQIFNYSREDGGVTA